MTVGFWEADGNGIWAWAEFLPGEVLAFMRKHGLRLKYAGSSVVKEPHWRQVCPHCGGMQGDFYVTSEAIVSAAKEDIQKHRSRLLYCPNCDRVFPDCC